jgi:aminopeptidase YwaD
MKEYSEFVTQVISALSLENMIETVNHFSSFHRYSGKEQGEASVNYLVKKLQEYNVSYERESYEGFFSIPISASLTVIAPISKTYEACGCVFSGEAFNLRAEIYYDILSEERCLTLAQEKERNNEFKGKIILTRDGRAEFADRLKKAGALGMVSIWPAEDGMLHHSNIGPIWGTPDTRDYDRLTFLPAVTFRLSDSREIISMCKSGTVDACLNIKMDTGIAKSTMPIASIPGKTGKFVLMSGHYDSWYEGITDNAAANAIMLEVARILKGKQCDLLRGVKICWWSGHSDGRYAGSTWWCDNHWEELKKNCVAHINLDICGCKNTGKILMRTTLMEGMDYTADKIERLTGIRPEKYIPMIKGADQSFWGVGVPITLMAKNEPLPGNEKTCGDFYGAGGGPWWHAIGDTLDKLDVDAMLRDAKINLDLVAEMATLPTLPVKMSDFTHELLCILDDLQKNIDQSEFNITPVLQKIKQLAVQIEELEEHISVLEAGTSDEIIKSVAGELVRIVYTTVDPYHYEPATSITFGTAQSTAFWGLRVAFGVTRENVEAITFLCIKTTFIRQRNRLIGQMDEILYRICNYLKELREE